MHHVITLSVACARSLILVTIALCNLNRCKAAHFLILTGFQLLKNAIQQAAGMGSCKTAPALNQSISKQAAKTPPGVHKSCPGEVHPLAYSTVVCSFRIAEHLLFAATPVMLRCQMSV